MNLEKILKESLYVHKEILDDEKNSADYRWQHKAVEKQLCLYDGTSLDNLTYSPAANCTLSRDVYKTKSSSLHLKMSTDIENVVPRPWPSVHIKIDQFNLDEYNRIACDVYITATGYQNFYVQFSLGYTRDVNNHAVSLKPNAWNHVIWELDKDLQKEYKEVIISPWLMGTPPEGLPAYDMYIDAVYAQKVKLDYTTGWMLAERVAYAHNGYLIDDDKIALTQKNRGNNFAIFKGKKEYLNKNIKQVKTELGEYIILDFTNIKEEGKYTIHYGDYVSKPFLISKKAYDESIWKSINFLRLLRCGEDIEGVHSACHLNCKTVHPITKAMVPNFGGWHDAGDVSQFEIPTAEMSHAIIDLALTYKNTDVVLYERLKEEARVGINWLLRTRFGDGYRAMAVTYNYWRKNVLNDDNKTVYNNVAENGPFENFCSSAALAKAYLLYLEDDEIFASWCLRAAVEDFAFARDGYEQGIYTKRWGPSIPSQTLGHGILAACELYRATNDYKYIEQASIYAKIVLACQETIGVGENNYLKGFFYEDELHKWMLTYEHRGHEQSPIQGLVELCMVAPNHKDYANWYQGIMLYASYIKNTLTQTSPYGLLPGHVYIIDKINPDRFTIPASYGTLDEGIENLKRQAMSGKKIAEGIYLRSFPIAVQRRGYHATLLSKTKAVSEIYKLTNDQELRQIVINQLEWVLGKNPFAASTMYGCGYNYHPLYVAFSRQMVGALPVGIMTKGDLDAPHWPVRDNAVFKEIWGHTTGKYLWVLADFIKQKKE